MEAESHKKSKNNSILIASAVIVLLILVAGGSYYYGRKSTPNRFMAMMQEGGNPDGPRPSGKPGGPGMNMTTIAPPAVSDQQTEQLASGSSIKITQKTFNITGGNFYFVPNKITVNKGDQVTFVMTNAGGMHDLVIDELNVKTPVVKTGTAVSATFTATKTGTFTYYCDVPGHREKGMLGTLTVQ